VTEDGRSVSELELQVICWVITSEHSHTPAFLRQIGKFCAV